MQIDTSTQKFLNSCKKISEKRILFYFIFVFGFIVGISAIAKGLKVKDNGYVLLGIFFIYGAFNVLQVFQWKSTTYKIIQNLLIELEKQRTPFDKKEE